MDIAGNDTTERVRFEDLTVDYDKIHGDNRPYLDRVLTAEQVAALDGQQRFWRENGYLILPKFMPDELIDAYCKLRETCPSVRGWGPVPYQHFQEVRDFALYRPLMAIIEKLLGVQAVLCLNLTGWVSSERDWHQDEYLNTPDVKGSYLATWCALDDISPDSGPFEFVPKSHTWPVMWPDAIRARLTPFEAAQTGKPGDAGSWHGYSQKMCSEATEDYLARRNAPVKQLIAKRGDVMIWHSCLMHRGSEPKVPGMLRKTIISHYMGRPGRPDWLDEELVQDAATGGTYKLMPGWPLGLS